MPACLDALPAMRLLREGKRVNHLTRVGLSLPSLAELRVPWALVLWELWGQHRAGTHEVPGWHRW